MVGRMRWEFVYVISGRMLFLLEWAFRIGGMYACVEEGPGKIFP